MNVISDLRPFVVWLVPLSGLATACTEAEQRDSESSLTSTTGPNEQGTTPTGTGSVGTTDPSSTCATSCPDASGEASSTTGGDTGADDACRNGMHDPGEWKTDCGGSCAPCVLDLGLHFGGIESTRLELRWQLESDPTALSHHLELIRHDTAGTVIVQGALDLDVPGLWADGLSPDHRFGFELRVVDAAGAALGTSPIEWTRTDPERPPATELVHSVHSGSWTDPATWSEGVVPGADQRVVLGDGHEVRIAAHETVVIGTSPEPDADLPAIAPSSPAGTGTLIVDGTLRFRGPVRQANATWAVHAGAALEHDASRQPLADYDWQIGMADDQNHAVLRLMGNGPGLRRVRVRNAPGSPRFSGFHNGTSVRNLGEDHWSYDGFSGAGRIEASWTEFLGLGREDEEWWTADLGRAQDRAFLDHCIVRESSGIVILGIAGASKVRLRSTSILDPTTPLGLRLQFDDALDPAGERRIEHSVIEGSLFTHSVQGLTVTESVLAGGQGEGPPLRGSGYEGYFAELRDTLIYSRNAGESDHPNGLVRGLVSLRGDTASGLDGDHFRGNRPFFVEGSGIDIDGVVAEYEGQSTGGEIFIYQPGDGGSPYPISVRNALVLPNGGGDTSSSDSLVAVVGGDSRAMTITVDNNTACGSTGILLFELNASVAGVVESVRNNLNWNRGGQGAIVEEDDNQLVDGTIVVADHNGRFGISARPYEPAPEVFVVPPGEHDLVDDPQFFDDSRDFLSWGQTLDPRHDSWASIYAEIRRLNDDFGHDPRYDWREFYRWAREGFTPQNPRYANGGSDGGWIGAVDPDE